MTGQTCAVVSCRNNRLHVKKQGSSIKFHSFPKGNNVLTTDVRAEWIRRCGRQDKFNANLARICSLHFTDDDYERDLKHELLGLPLRRFLKKTAVPSQSLSIEHESENVFNETPRTKRSNKLSVLTETTQETTTELKKDFRCLDEPSTPKSPLSFTSMSDDDQPSTSLNIDNTEIDYKQKYEDLLWEFHRYKRDSRKKITGLRKTVKFYKTRLNILSLKKKDKLHTVENFLNNILTNNQLSLLPRKKKRVCGADMKKRQQHLL